eukprot:1881926-Rhodomonas_salina.4
MEQYNTLCQYRESRRARVGWYLAAVQLRVVQPGSSIRYDVSTRHRETCNISTGHSTIGYAVPIQHCEIRNANPALWDMLCQSSIMGYAMPAPDIPIRYMSVPDMT